MHAHHTPVISFIRRLALGSSVVVLLTACGYKGPLYMPPPPAPDAELTNPPPPSQPLTEGSPDTAPAITTSPVE